MLSSVSLQNCNTLTLGVQSSLNIY